MLESRPSKSGSVIFPKKRDGLSLEAVSKVFVRRAAVEQGFGVFQIEPCA